MCANHKRHVGLKDPEEGLVREKTNSIQLSQLLYNNHLYLQIFAMDDIKIPYFTYGVVFLHIPSLIKIFQLPLPSKVTAYSSELHKVENSH